MRANTQTRLTCWWRRPWMPALSSCIYILLGIGVCVFVVTISRTPLTPLERDLVGRWFTTHGNIETNLELGDNHLVTISQSIKVALSPGVSRVFGPMLTVGRWRVENGHLRLETASRELRDTPWKMLGVFARSQHWPARGELHRDWRIEKLAEGRLRFTDTGTGQRGHPIKTSPPQVAAR